MGGWAYLKIRDCKLAIFVEKQLPLGATPDSGVLHEGNLHGHQLLPHNLHSSNDRMAEMQLFIGRLCRCCKAHSAHFACDDNSIASIFPL